MPRGKRTQQPQSGSSCDRPELDAPPELNIGTQRQLQTLMLAIVESQDFDKALEIVLRTVCETKGWNYGEAWIPCPDETVLTCSSAWYSRADGRGGVTPFVLKKFRTTSEKFTFAPGIGLPGRVWFSKQPEWRENVLEEPEIIFQRTEIARNCGLRSGLGMPLIVNDQVLAVLVFFKFESSKEDILLVESITAVAAQLGSVIQRKQMEELLALDIIERQQAEDALKRQFHRTLLLKQITEAIRQSLDTKSVFQTAVAQIGQAFLCNRCLIHTYITTPTAQTPLVAEYLEPGYESILGLDVPVIDNPDMKQLLATEQAIASSNVYAEPLAKRNRSAFSPN